MPLSRRKEVAEILRRHEVLFFEDDAYGKLEPNAVPLASLVPERTYFAASLSKCTAPGLRVSLLLTPDQASAEVLASALRASVQCPRFLWSRWSPAGFRMAAPRRLLALFSMKHPRDRSWLRTCSCSMRIHDIRTATTSGSPCRAIGARRSSPHMFKGNGWPSLPQNHSASGKASPMRSGFLLVPRAAAPNWSERWRSARLH